MKSQQIRCLEKVLSPLEEVFFLNPLLEPQSRSINQQKIFSKIENFLREFCENFSNLREKSISEIMRILSHILGYGLGSTPESDDIFLGILATIYCFNSHVSKEFEILSQIPFERFTTKKSAKLCRRFLNQNFPFELLPFLELLKTKLKNNKTKSRFEQEIRKIRTIGASSGEYFLLGVLWKLQFNDKHSDLVNLK
ncbi:MAG: oxamate carbamoyltransferase subunit AllH family protein [Candidatus Hodarchaeales archaeon]